MSHWNEGYVTDIDYTHGYYPELNPRRLALLLLAQGIQPPQRIEHACELGFGQGLSINVHAATGAGATQWWGTDFNAGQTAFAQDVARASGSGARLFDQSFAEFCARTDLPEFDYITLHGIWSWIGDDNHQVIVDFIRRKLKVGGVLYMSYNTLPGWASFAPMQHLLAQHGDTYSASGASSLSRVQGALDFADRLLATQPLYAQANPTAGPRTKALRERDANYLAHEYFNRNWCPMYFADMARWLEPAKLQYAGSAQFLDIVDAFHLTPEQQALLRDIANPMFRQSVRDFMVNQQFRRDLWVKGARRLNPLAQAEALQQQRVMLVTPRGQVSHTVPGLGREATLRAEVYDPLLDLLADHKPRTLGQIAQALHSVSPVFTQWLQAVLVLSGAGHLAPLGTEQPSNQANEATRRLNAWATAHARGSAEVNYLASPVTGQAIPVGRFQQLFLHARSQGARTPQDWAAYAWRELAAQNQRLVGQDGKPIESAEDNLAELTRRAEAFATDILPMLQTLRIA